jgi:hypothetical protein
LSCFFFIFYSCHCVFLTFKFFPSLPVGTLHRSGKPLEDALAWLRQGVDALLIASHLDPIAHFSLLFPYLLPSGSFAVYSTTTEPCTEIYASVRFPFPRAVDLQLSEAWMREYQVKRGATHPAMAMSGASGFVLSGVKVATACITMPTSITNKGDFNRRGQKKKQRT